MGQCSLLDGVDGNELGEVKPMDESLNAQDPRLAKQLRIPNDGSPPHFGGSQSIECQLDGQELSYSGRMIFAEFALCRVNNATLFKSRVKKTKPTKLILEAIRSKASELVFSLPLDNSPNNEVDQQITYETHRRQGNPQGKPIFQEDYHVNKLLQGCPQQFEALSEHHPLLEVAQSYDFEVVKIDNEAVIQLLQLLGPFHIQQRVESPLVLGPYIFIETGDIYTGGWKLRQRHGIGKQVYSDGQYFEGLWAEDAPNGYGRMIYSTGMYYIGELQSGLRHGNGQLIYVDNSTYEGMWEKDLKNGEGIETMASGVRYVGSFVNGCREGTGRIENPDGSVFEGEFKNGLIHGVGIQSWTDGRRYEGEWKHGLMDGNGEFIWNEGKKYKGEYCKNLRHGQGEYWWPDGRNYNGQWKEGVMHGKGVIVYPDTRFEKGVWVNGVKYEKKKKVSKGENVKQSSKANSSKVQDGSKLSNKTPEQRESKLSNNKSLSVQDNKK